MLFRRREVWIPTWRGSLLLIALVALLCAAAALGIGGFLAVDEPARGAQGAGARTLVVEGWLGERDLLQATQLALRGRYARVLTSGGPMDAWDGAGRWANYAERAADFLRSHGVVAVPVSAVPAPASAQERTFLSAVKVRDWIEHAGLAIDAAESIDVFTAGAHARRSRLLYRLAFGPAVEVGVIASPPSREAARRWWRGSGAAKTVLAEALGLAWTECCFWPPPRGSHEEQWAVPRDPR
jgi:hypothetical protein